MSVEDFVGVLAGVQAHSLGVVTWAASSFVEALAWTPVVAHLSAGPLCRQRSRRA